MAQSNENTQNTQDTAPDFEFDGSVVNIGFNAPKEEEVKVEEVKEVKEIDGEEVKEVKIKDAFELGVTQNLGFGGNSKEDENVIEDKTQVATNQMPEGGDNVAWGTFQELVSKGYMTEDEKFDGTYDSLSSKFDKLPEQIFAATVNDMPESLQNLLQYGFSKGESLTSDDLQDYFNKYGSKPKENIDLTTEEGQVSYLTKELLSTGNYDKDDVIAQIERWQDTEKLEEKSKAIFEKNKTTLDLNEQNALAQAKANKKIDDANKLEFATSVKTLIGDSKWKPTYKEKILGEIFSDSLQIKSKAIYEHPKALIQLARFMNYFDVKTGIIDETAYKKQMLSDATTTVKSTIEKHFENNSFSNNQNTIQTGKKKAVSYVFA